MPPDKVFFTDWDSDRFLRWGESIGPSTRKVIALILDRAVIEQQAYRSCFGILSLKNKHSEHMLERACTLVLERTSTPTYQQIKNILEKEKQPTEKLSEPVPLKDSVRPKGHRRGASYFGGEDNA